jgi:cupin fold WbuC family metalloprotein
MPVTPVPPLTSTEISNLLALADASPRHRHAHILHAPGDEFNRVFNAMRHDSYMQPHLHPGDEKIEHIHLVLGEIALFFFDDHGSVTTTTLMRSRGVEHVAVPAFTWHTYAILSGAALTYETMMGVYEPQTWKTMGGWAPPEQGPEAVTYLAELKRRVRPE